MNTQPATLTHKDLQQWAKVNAPECGELDLLCPDTGYQAVCFLELVDILIADGRVLAEYSHDCSRANVFKQWRVADVFPIQALATIN